jgi:hypothetical protein
MFNRSKLRGPVGRIYPITILSFYIIGVIEFLVRLYYIDKGYVLEKGPVYSIIAVALFFFLMGIYQYWRYRLWVFFVLGIILGYSSFQSLFAYVDWYFDGIWYAIGIIITILYIVVTWPVLAGHERFESKTRRLFKLAVDQIKDTEAGFTARPYNAGEAAYTLEEARGLARYLKSKHVALPVFRNDGVYLMFSLGKSLMTGPEPEEVSYALLWKSGEVRIHISAFDYKQYTKRYSFDQLCQSFGDIFKRFLEYYKEGHEDRIMAELKSV